METAPAYVFAGGGTGGHLFPGIALAEELRARAPAARIVFVGSERQIERGILADQGYAHRPLPVEPSTMLRRHPLRFAWRNWTAWRAADRLLRQDHPAAVIGLGGFASVPIVMSATRQKIPTLILEQNTVPGRATRWLCRRVDRTCLSFAQTVDLLPSAAQACVVGNPVRREIARLHESNQAEHRRPGKPTLLILGGSQGARAVNDAVVQTVAAGRDRWNGWRIVHQTGHRQADETRRRYAELQVSATVAPFFSDLPVRYADADIVVARAGATTLAELACAGCPAVLIPYPHAAGDHQLVNARVYESAGAARVVPQARQPAETAQRLERELTTLWDDAARLATMRQAMFSLARPEAAVEVADQLDQLTGHVAARAREAKA